MKTIGIPGWIMEGKYFGVSIPYIEFAERFGKLEIITPKDMENPPKLDLLILPGGADINPIEYGETPSYRTGAPNLMLEHFDNNILPYYIESGTPIFGICRGAQKLWTHYGGKFIQHDPYHKQSNYPTDQCHELYFTENFKDWGKGLYSVTSRHHQTMDGSREEFIPRELEVIAYANEKIKESDDVKFNVVEIFRHRNKNMYGVQYHPEDHRWDNLSGEIVEKLLNIRSR